MAYNVLASKDIVDKTTSALKSFGYTVIVAANKTEALEKIKGFIPKNASVMTGSSVSLEEIGFVDLLKSGKHKWNNLKDAIVAEKDPVKQGILRKQALTSDFYLGSVHALAQTGEFIIASNTGSQLPHVVFTSPNLIFVVGTQKIVPTLADGLKRLEEYVVPLEDEHMLKLYNMHTQLSKILIFRRESAMIGRKVTLILVNEKLGF